MSKQQELNARKHLSNRPSTIGALTTRPPVQCSKELYLRSGFHGSPGGQFAGAVEAFTPICCLKLRWAIQLLRIAYLCVNRGCHGGQPGKLYRSGLLYRQKYPTERTL
jgi:hypothetical protein